GSVGARFPPRPGKQLVPRRKARLLPVDPDLVDRVVDRRAAAVWVTTHCGGDVFGEARLDAGCSGDFAVPEAGCGGGEEFGHLAFGPTGAVFDEACSDLEVCLVDDLGVADRKRVVEGARERG